MKKILILITAVILFFNTCSVYAEGGITLYLDGEKVSCDPAPEIINNRTMIPVRAVYEKMGAKVLWDEKTRTVSVSYKEIKIEMKIGSDVATVNGMGMKLDAPAIIKNDRTMIPLRFIGEAVGSNVLWEDKTRSVYITSPEEVPPVIIEDVNFSKKDGYDSLTMTSSGKAAVSIMRLKEPERIVFDIQNASLAVKNASYTGSAVSEVRYGGHDNFVRIVAENPNTPRYILTDTGGFTELKLFKEKGNFDYIGMSEHRLVFKEGSYVSYKEKNGNVLRFSSNTELEDESLKINDELIDTVTVKGGIIDISLKKSADFTVTENNVVFTVNEEVKHEIINETGIVVLDAGHGGKDPGTLGFDKDGKTVLANEKDMNLTLTLMVYEMLAAQGVKVVLTRKDDTYLGLLERAEYANKHNAELFVSIHNNSIPDPEYKGSMVLYSLKSKGGKVLASNILREMTKSANTENKGLRDGTNMAVIRNTAMPAVIVECGCLTNAGELENLMDIDFLYSLAEGIAEGILITLES